MWMWRILMSDLVKFNASFNNKEVNSVMLCDIKYDSSIKDDFKSNCLVFVKYNSSIYCSDRSLGGCLKMLELDKKAKLEDVNYCCVECNNSVLTLYADSVGILLNGDEFIENMRSLRNSFIPNRFCKTLREVKEEC